MPAFVVVVPCYNEARRLDESAFVEFAMGHPDFTFFFVDDGSSDRTIDRLAALQTSNPAQFRYLKLEENVGKAEAVRAGINACMGSDEFDYFGFLDADLSAPVGQILLLRDALDREDARMVMGSRVKRLGADITRRPVRHYLGRAFATFVSLALDLDVYDSQCGIKLFDRDFAMIAFAAPFCTKWIFDVEILIRLRAHERGFESRVVEVPLTIWMEKRGSKISLASFLNIPLDVLRIRRTYPLSFRRRGERGQRSGA